LNTLIIGKPYIRQLHNKSRLSANIRWPAGSRTIWFEVDSDYEPYLCTERIDAFLVSLLPFAMLENCSIRSEGSLSERLSYQISTVLLPSLTGNIRRFHPVSIDAPSDGTVLASARAVATGLSCGVDSFYTALNHIDTPTKSFDLTHVTYFNIMNHMMWQAYGEDSSRDFSNARINYVRPAANELGLRLVAIDTNSDAFYHGHSLQTTFPFRYLGTVLALQKLFGTYYWSSGYSFSQFAFTIDDLATCDLLTVQCLSNENTAFYSTGAAVTRLDKTDYISAFPVTHKYLNVCWNNLYNCTDNCDKCKRTLLGLYALGKIDLYRDVFDLDKFYRNIDQYLKYMLFMWTRETHQGWYGEIYKRLAERGIRVPESRRQQLRWRLEHVTERIAEECGLLWREGARP